jgi:hypothetical protein
MQETLVRIGWCPVLSWSEHAQWEKLRLCTYVCLYLFKYKKNCICGKQLSLSELSICSHLNLTTKMFQALDSEVERIKLSASKLTYIILQQNFIITPQNTHKINVSHFILYILPKMYFNLINIKHNNHTVLKSTVIDACVHRLVQRCPILIMGPCTVFP